MPKNEEFTDLGGSSPTNHAAKDLAPSPPAKYRLRSSDNGPSSPLSASSPTSWRSTPNVGAIHALIKRTSALRMTGTSSTILESPSKPPSPSNPKAKLPNKLRQHVSRLQKQFAMTTAGASSLASLSSKGSKTHILASSPLSAVRRQSPKQQGTNFQTEYSWNSIRMLSNSANSENQQSTWENETNYELEADGNEEDANISFMDLLKPLRSSLSCASLMSEWETKEDEKDDIDELHFRESERNSSRMLRICCSVDNLMLSIGGQVHEQKHDGVLARGASRELMHLFRFAIHQVTPVLSAVSSDIPRNPSYQKEEQYAREFLVEIANRVVLLDRFNRSTFVKEMNSLQLQMTEFQTENESLKRANEQLQLEFAELRDFNAQNNAMALDFSGKSDGVPKTLHRVSTAEQQEIASLLESPSPTTNENDSTSNALEFYTDQCKEYARLLEIAKEEIRLCHHDREVQNQRISELSSTIFKDHEVVLLRNQLQSEKRRVKNLEMENLSLLETQVDQSHKIQSLLLNGGHLRSNSKTPESNMLRASSVEHGETQRDPKSSTHEMMRRLISENMVNTDDSKAQNCLVITVLNEGTSIEELETSCASVQQGRESKEKFTLKTEASESVWIYRLIGYFPQEYTEQDSDTLQELTSYKQFLSSLLMSSSQLASARIQAKRRKQVNIPTISPPATFSSTQSTNDKSTRKHGNSASAKEKSCSPSSNNEQVLTLCRQMIWFFYQRFLMVEEAQDLLSGSRQRKRQQSLVSVVVHFFLERKIRDEDGFSDIRQFVKCLHAVRHEAGDVEIFCDFLEGKRDRSELCYLLWVLQTIESVNLGISYDGPLAPSSVESSFSVATGTSTQFICTLKATFVTRLIFRTLHFKRASHAKAAKSPARAKLKALTKGLPTSPASTSPKAKHKRRMLDVSSGVPENYLPDVKLVDATGTHSLFEYARKAFQAEIERNNGNPISLEDFNTILLHFAQATPADELVARLGSFYRPNGEEQKLSLDIFLILLLEMFQHQTEWRKQEMQQLFIALHRQQEVQELAALERVKEMESRFTRKDRSKAVSPIVIKPKTKKIKLDKKKKKTISNAMLATKYLKGLNRKILQEFLVQSRLVPIVHQINIDELYAEVLEFSSQNAEDVHFDQLYGALKELGWLDARQLKVETTAMQLQYNECNPRRNEFGKRLQEIWRVQGAQSIALCENDPNIFMRKYFQSMMQAIDERFSSLHSVSISKQSEFSIWEILRDIRGVLDSAWHLAAKRNRDLRIYGNSGQANDAVLDTDFCLAELYFVNQAIRILSDNCDVDYDVFIDRNGTITQIKSVPDLSVFYNVEGMKLDDLLASDNPSQMASNADCIKRKLHYILQRYSVHLSHLFNSFSSSRLDIGGLTSEQWQALVIELHLLNHKLSIAKAQELFVYVYNGGSNVLDDVFLDGTHFVELLIRFAWERYLVTRPCLMRQSKLDLAQVVTSFCQEVIAPNAFNHRHRLQEEDFRKRISCPLIGRVLLEHRALMRAIFLAYAKNHLPTEAFVSTVMNHQEPNNEISISDDSVHSTKRRYLLLADFQRFMQDFHLYSHPPDVTLLHSDNGDYVFRSTMSLDNDDVSRMEFDEFTAAVAAIASYDNPSPFVLWHVKIDALAAKLAKRWGILQNTFSSR